MQFNKYIWELYRQSKQGKKSIKTYSTLTIDILKKKFGLDDVEFEIDKEKRNVFETDTMLFNITKVVRDYVSKFKIDNTNEATNLFESLVREGISLQSFDKNNQLTTVSHFGKKGFESDWYHFITNVSFGLYLAHPEFFTPYAFYYCFDYLEQICGVFKVPLPSPSGKRNHLERAMYYSQLNKSFYEFRKLHDLSPAEMCAFLYDFTPNFVEPEDTKELPKPSKAWLIKGGKAKNGDFEFLDSITEDSTSHWQGNIDIRRGDILLMYCLSPRSYIHSIWRAISDGFIDPFFYYHTTVWIGSPIKTVPVTFKELKNDPLLSKKGLIKADLQGPSGNAFSVEEYNAVLNIMKGKGQDISILPKLEPVTYLGSIEPKNEIDVEKYLIEPLLKELGYSENDWLRQMPIKMGRGERNYPDYAFGANLKRGEESAKMILEVKYQISIRRELTDAYYQAKSYALRLQTKILVLASKEGIWIYPYKKGDFNLDYFIQKNWNELNHPDVLHEIMLKIARKKMLE